VVGHRVKTIFLLDTDHSHILRDAADVGIHKNDTWVIGSDRNDFGDQLVQHDGVNFVAQVVQSILVRLKLPDPVTTSQFVNDHQGDTVIVTIGISISNDERSHVQPMMKQKV